MALGGSLHAEGNWVRHPCTLNEVEEVSEEEPDFEPVLRACFDDACLDGEADQLAEVLRLRSSFRAGKRSVRNEVEAEFRKFADALWDVDSAIGEYEGMRAVDADTLSSPKGRPLPSSAFSATDPSPPQTRSPASSRMPIPPTAGLPKEQRPPRPSCGANSAPQSPAGSGPAGVPHFRRFFPARTYSSRHSPSAGSDIGSNVSESSTTTASSSHSSPQQSKPPCSSRAEPYWSSADLAPHAGRRRYLTQRLQQKMQERHQEWPELTTEDRYADDHSDEFEDERSRSKRTSRVRPETTRSHSRGPARCQETDGVSGDEHDWYAPPDAYNWSGASGSSYSFASRSEEDNSRNSTFTRSPRGTYSFPRPTRCQDTDSAYMDEQDWYAPPDSYIWSGGSGTSYSFAFRPEEGNSQSSAFNRSPHGRQPFTFSRSERRTNTAPAQPQCQPPSPHKSPSASSSAKTSPTAASTPRPPRPPSGRPVPGSGAWRHNTAPPMQNPGMRHQWNGTGWCPPRNGWCRSTAPGSPTAGNTASAGGTPRQPPPPPPQPPPSSATAAAAAVQSNAVQGLEARLQGLRRLPKEEQRKASKEMLVQWHPDKNPERGEEATRVFQWLQNRRKEVLGF